jgi:Holliday junction resolvase
MSRDKGQRGERELFALLSDELGIIVQRRIDAAREGGCDSLDVPGWAIECKRTETLLSAHWEQAVYQARDTARKPVLFWRPSRKPWQAHVNPHDLFPDYFSPYGAVIVMPLGRWCEYVRSTL